MMSTSQVLSDGAVVSSPVVFPHGTLYYMFSSMTYLLICLGSIILLVVVLIAIISVCCSRLKPKSPYSRRTVRYSTLPEEEVQMVNKRPPPPTKLGTVKRRTPQVAAGGGYDPTSTPLKTSQQWTLIPPVSPHVDINAGHLLLSYIEENLQDRNRLDKEWEQLLSYNNEDSTASEGGLPGNKHKNRYPDILPYDHRRVHLDPQNSITGSDYINASYIVNVDPNHPMYIVTQGPMQHTIADFWQMVWEQDIFVIVMLTPLMDMGMSQSCQYWPSSGVTTHHIFEIRLVSEHHHNDNFIIRSFYILNNNLQQSRTVTQFQFLTWSSAQPPSSLTPILEFRRKVITAHQKPIAPLLIHCSEGVGRTGTYCLIDMTLTRIGSGAKEINLAATVEHLRDQRPKMVKTKAQFEFALSALVEETQQMLDAARQLAPR